MMKRELSIVNKRYDKMKIELERSMQRETELLKFKVSSTKSIQIWRWLYESWIALSTPDSDFFNRRKNA